MKAERQQAEQAAASINQGRLNPQQKRQMLLNHPNPGIRAKAQEALRSKQQPRSSLDQPGPVAALVSLAAMLNPLAPAVADAQVPFAVTLTPQVPFHPATGSYLNLRGTSVYAGKQGLTAFVLSHYPSNALVIGIEGALGFRVQKPYVQLSVTIPSDRWYLLDVYGNGKPKAALHKQTSSFNPTVVELWDMTASPTFLNHFATAEYLAQGNHTFYFKIDEGSLYFYEASIEAF